MSSPCCLLLQQSRSPRTVRPARATHSHRAHVPFRVLRDVAGVSCVSHFWHGCSDNVSCIWRLTRDAHYDMCLCANRHIVIGVVAGGWSALLMLAVLKKPMQTTSCYLNKIWDLGLLSLLQKGFVLTSPFFQGWLHIEPPYKCSPNEPPLQIHL